MLMGRLSSLCHRCLMKRQVHRDVMNVFNREAKRMQKNRTARLEDAEVYDYLRKETAYLLYDRINDIKRHFNVLVELGCHRGHASELLTKDTCDLVYQCDMAEKVLCKSKVPADIPTHRVTCDEEFLPFADNSIDIIISNLSLHWVNDLPSAFRQIQHALVPDGVFIGCMFGGDTLCELRGSLQLAEMEREGGFGPHISPFTDARDIGDLLNSAGFTLLTIDADSVVVKYPGLIELMQDLQGMGENNCAWNSKALLHRESLLAAAAIYTDMYGNEDGTIPATYQVYFMIGWKPHPSQQRPASRGSGQVSLKDLDKIDELIDEQSKVKPK